MILPRVKPSGSPPRMRGKLSVYFCKLYFNGITPADAGKTQTADDVHGADRDHPRGCGENRAMLRTLQCRIGSPPRMRGKRKSRQSCLRKRRITPADAGKTAQFPCCVVSAQGSPPRMRGKLGRFDIGRTSERITPADAGKTMLTDRLQPIAQDHPRGCGENSCCTCARSRFAGSPPQVRGKLGNSRNLKGVRRITPAGAGKTFSRVVICAVCGDHPRRCGENRYAAQKAGFLTLFGAFRCRDHPRRCGENQRAQCGRLHKIGSPPQVRGKPKRAICLTTIPRITPAGAGKTKEQQKARSETKDHPRRCGENPLKWGFLAYCLGSPPQVRGKLLQSTLRLLSCRITPAGAGKTRGYTYSHPQKEDHPRRCGENYGR